MNFFYWNKNFEIGIEEIDRQHRGLVDLINRLAVAITEGGKLPDVQFLFGQLMEYAAIHFSDEEKLLAACPLPEGEKEKHRKAHQGFVVKAREIIRRPDLLQAEVAEQVLEFLTTWLISHILGSDRKIAESLGRSGSGVHGEQRLFDISPVERVLLGALSETERRFRLISDHTPVLIWVADAKGVRGFFNRAWTDFVGIPHDAIQDAGAEWSEFIHPDDRMSYLAVLRELAVTRKPAEVEYRLRRHDGDYRWFLEKLLPRVDANDTFMGLVASATDISSIKQAEALLSRANQQLEHEVARRTAQLEKLILTDTLTGVGSRRHLTRRLEEETIRAQRYHRPLSAIFFDLDHFKCINDVHGHAMGDIVLVDVAARLQACLRDSDVLGRMGGEEFVALLPETDLGEAIQLAERICRDIAGMQWEKIPHTITISAGVAERARDESGEAMLQRSDLALYRAKEAGRNCCRADGSGAS